MTKWMIFPAFLFALQGQNDDRMRLNQHYAKGALNMIVSCNVTFRTSDSDMNGRTDWWCGDVSGLYRVLNERNAGEWVPIKFITEDVARADASPLPQRKGLDKPLCDKPQPYRGYLFLAVPQYESEDGKVAPHDSGGGCSDDRFAFCAFPAEYGKTGKLTLLVSQEFKMYCKDTEGTPVTVLPADPVKAGWEDIKALKAPEKSEDPEVRKWICEENLKRIGTMMEIYRRDFGGPNYEVPSVTGPEFFKTLLEKVAKTDEDRMRLVCPFTSKKPGEWSYRGPRKNVNQTKNYHLRQAIICDDPSNHPDGTIHILTRGYIVKEYKKDSEEYKKALEDTQD